MSKYEDESRLEHLKTPSQLGQHRLSPNETLLVSQCFGLRSPLCQLKTKDEEVLRKMKMAAICLSTLKMA